MTNSSIDNNAGLPATQATPKASDWDDVANAMGDPAALEHIKDVLAFAIKNPNAAKINVDLKPALERYALIDGSTNVYDTQQKMVMKKSSFIAKVTRPVASAWFDATDKKLMQPQQVKADTAKAGGYDTMLSRYALIYGTLDCFDLQKMEQVTYASLKLASPDGADYWLRSDKRRTIDPQDIVFDPSCTCDNTKINKFVGMPLTPLELAGDDLLDRCKGIVALLQWICGSNDEVEGVAGSEQEWFKVYDFVLKWLAYPLQHLGSKLDTSLIFHGDVQGVGKSLFFGKVMRKIYGSYGATLGQHQLESQYTDWKSQKLYCLFEEIFSQNNKYSNMGTVKHHVTGDTFRVEKKFHSGWEEANYANSVFLSNELQPLPVEANDRRFLVVWPRHKLPTDIQRMVADELAGDGVQAFYQLLLTYNLGDFKQHTPPIDTQAKADLIGYGLRSYELWYKQWQAGELDIPYCGCASADAFRAYRRWSERMGERSVAAKVFCAYLGKRCKAVKPYIQSGGASKQERGYVPLQLLDGTPYPDTDLSADFIRFRKAINVNTSTDNDLPPYMQ